MMLQKPKYINLTKILLRPKKIMYQATLKHYFTRQFIPLTVVCNFTGYLLTTPLPDEKTMTVAVHLFSEIILKFGISQILHSHNGQNLSQN